jgi:hypothetical protein
MPIGKQALPTETNKHTQTHTHTRIQNTKQGNMYHLDSIAILVIAITRSIMLRAKVYIHIFILNAINIFN